MTINRTILTGNITREPELRQTPSGTAVLAFSIAFNERYKNTATGEYEDHPNFIDCNVFGNRANGLAKVLKKGTHVALEGRLRWSQWERDGQKRSKIDLTVDNVELDARRTENAEPANEEPYEPEMAPYDLM